MDPIEAAQITGHSPDVWARYYARSFGKAQREEARRRMLEHGFGAAEPEAEEPRANGCGLAPTCASVRVPKSKVAGSKPIIRFPPFAQPNVKNALRRARLPTRPSR